MTMNRAVWAIQVVLGVFFVVLGVLHLALPESLPSQLGWMHDLPPWLHYVSGAAEILGGLGLILPGLTGIRTTLTPLAAASLALVMLFAAVWHVPRGEVRNAVLNIVVAGVLTAVAYVRGRRIPLPPAERRRAEVT
jgi:uncharacterized membrane protein